MTFKEKNILLSSMLSIIIPTLNEEKYLPLLLDSIKKQDFGISEIIVADANSTDRTVEIAKSYGCKVIKGGRPAKGRNEGAKKAKGDLLLFLDADVILSAGFLKKFLEKFQKEKVDLATTGLSAIGKRKIYKIGSHVWNFYFDKNQRFLPCAGGYCILVRKETHERLGGFDEEIKVAEDFIYARKAKKIAKFKFFKSPKVFVSVRRFEKEGLFKAMLKYILIELHLIFLGPVKSNIFNYRFGHYLTGSSENLNLKYRNFRLVKNFVSRISRIARQK